MIKNDREYRDMQIAVMVEDGPDERPEEEKRKIVQGYAATFNEPYVLFSDDSMVMREQIDPGAFDDCDMSDVIMQYNHEGRVFARISNNTLRVQPDDKGLFIEADLGGTELGRELYDEIAGGYTDKMSFGFKVEADEWTDSTEDGRAVYDRKITRVSKLFDVSAVSIPANDATSISVRSLADGVIERVRAERLEAERVELERRRAEIRARAVNVKSF